MTSTDQNRQALAALAARLKDPDPEARLAVVEELIALGDPAAQPMLVRSLFDEDKRIKRRCGEVLAKLGAGGLVLLFEGMLASDKPWMREAAAKGMGQFSSAPILPVLERVAQGGDPSLRRHALASLERQGQKGNAAAAAAFARLGSPSAEPTAPADPYDLDAPAPAPAPPPRRTRQVPVKPAAIFENRPPIAGPGGAAQPLKTCPVCGDPAPVNAFRCPNCKEQLRPDAPGINAALGGRVDDSQLAHWNARGCASMVDSGYGLVFAVVSAVIPGVRGYGGGVYNLLKDGLPGGQSWGKAKYRCRVVDAQTGRPATLVESVLRNLILVVPGVLMPVIKSMGLVMLLVMFVETVLVFTTRVRLGDMMAGTRVVGGDPDASLATMLGRLLLLALLVCGGCAAFVSTLVR